MLDLSIENQQKKDYKEQYETLFGNCNYMKTNVAKPEWADVEKHVYDYTINCQ